MQQFAFVSVGLWAYLKMDLFIVPLQQLNKIESILTVVLLINKVYVIIFFLTLPISCQ